MSTRLILYGTSACHLCDEALMIVQPIVKSVGLDLQFIDIAGDDTLEANYGIRIPVLVFQKRELGWPFDAADIRRILQNKKPEP